jgi:hypothetical protein
MRRNILTVETIPGNFSDGIARQDKLNLFFKIIIPQTFGKFKTV